MLEVYASDQYLLYVGLERVNAEAEDERAGIAELLVAVGELTAPWLRPLGVSFQFAHCDPSQYFEENGRPTSPHYFLRTHAVPEGVCAEQAFIDSVTAEVDEITKESVRDLVTRGLAQP